ncbi:MAG: hypothetical protein EBQ71_11525 [Betaproteobacteria bacterium]|nr:hypothetical protein [Betaproteobacteria bacterium]
MPEITPKASRIVLLLAQFFMPMWLIFIAWPIAGFMVIPMLIALLAVIVFPKSRFFCRVFFA